ncbi:MAG: hypothetical protein ACK2U2_18485 [Anaerolineae bacterium]|jgi:hypothetical protein
MYESVITKPVYQVLSELTQETKVEVALPLAIKDWVRLRLKEARQEREEFERRYGSDFATFQVAWQEGRIPDAHSHQVEQDYWEWEAAVTDEQQLQRMLDTLL